MDNANEQAPVEQPPAAAGTSSPAASDDDSGQGARAAAAAPRRRRASGSARGKKVSKAADATESKPRRRTQRPFPAAAFDDAVVLAEEIQRLAGGQARIRRITLFEQLDRSPDSGLARQQIVNSNRYGLTEGSYRADFLELTRLGQTATDPDAPPRERARARFEAAIANIAPFKSLYDSLEGNKLPNQQVMRDHLVENQNLTAEQAKEAVELFIVNAKHVGVLRPVAGTERVLSIDHVLDEMPATGGQGNGAGAGRPTAPVTGGQGRGRALTAGDDYSKACFYITPIGAEASVERKHADVFLGHLVEPAVEALDAGLQVVRADHIEDPGLITSQVIQHVLRAKLVIADLSFHNPNVFYELALRHATGKPTVLICWSEDKLPFDIADVRTVRVDMTDIHSFVTQMETWRAELTNMARRALDDPAGSANPLTAFAGEFQALVAR
jgi:hypothetical protein